MPVKTKKELSKAEKEIIAFLDGGKITHQHDFYYDGDTIQIPRGTELEMASKEILRVAESLKETASYERKYLYRPWDGAWCTHNALSRAFGSVSLQGKYGWFGQEPPQMISVHSGVGQQTQVPWGNFELPVFIPGVTFDSGTYRDSERGLLYRMSAIGPKKYEARINKVFDLVEMELRTRSLYRGKAFDGQDMPEFVDVHAIDRNKVVYSANVERQLSTHIWARIKHREIYERAGRSFKRAVLLHGPFGTGKTLGCMVTGQFAIENDTTFIVCRPGVDNIYDALQTARLYDPSVVFYEDADAAVGDDRDSISRLLDAFDGARSKGARVMVVMTTNYPDRIPAGMLRPGRIDRTIEIDDLDAQGIGRLVQTVIPPEQISPDVDWDAVFEHAQGYKPAFVTEFADEVVSYLIDHYGDDYAQHLVTTEILAEAAAGLRAQFDMMLGAKGMPTPLPLDQALRASVTEVVRQNIDSDYLAYNGS